MSDYSRHWSENDELNFVSSLGTHSLKMRIILSKLPPKQAAQRLVELLQTYISYTKERNTVWAEKAVALAARRISLIRAKVELL